MRYLILFVFLFSCSTLYAQNPERGDARVVILSDMNESYGSTHYDRYVDSALVYIEKWQPDAVLTGGDLVAGQSHDLDEENLRDMWRAFDETIHKPLREIGIPFAFTPGNHDASRSGSFDHERGIAELYWHYNRPDLTFVDDKHFPFYYSFTLDNLFILSWDASFHQISDTEQKWLTEQLQSEKALNADFRILQGHLPLYSVARGRDRFGEVLEDPDNLFDLIRDSGIDIYISGHHHAFYPAEKDGVLLLAAGAIGGGPRQLLGSDDPARRTVSLIDFFEESRNYTITTYDFEHEIRKLSIDELPDSIEGINGSIYRYSVQNP